MAHGQVTRAYRAAGQEGGHHRRPNRLASGCRRNRLANACRGVANLQKLRSSGPFLRCRHVAKKREIHYVPKSRRQRADLDVFFCRAPTSSGSRFGAKTHQIVIFSLFSNNFGRFFLSSYFIIIITILFYCLFYYYFLNFHVFLTFSFFYFPEKEKDK